MPIRGSPIVPVPTTCTIFRSIILIPPNQFIYFFALIINQVKIVIKTTKSADKKYDKTKLVPFGEFIPLESILGNLLDILGLKLTNTTPGKEIKPIKSGLINLSPSICYEIAFDNLIRETAEASNILLTVSNDTWFGKSIGPIQHLQIAQNRALEHQKPLVRATNSGISAFLSQKGEVIEKQDYFEEKNLKRRIMLYSGQSFYTNWGNYPLIFLIFLYFCYVFAKINAFRKKEL